MERGGEVSTDEVAEDDQSADENVSNDNEMIIVSVVSVSFTVLFIGWFDVDTTMSVIYCLYCLIVVQEGAADVDKVLASRLSDYDYLVTMQLIKLSMEEKDKLLKDRDDKQKLVLHSQIEWPFLKRMRTVGLKLRTQTKI